MAINNKHYLLFLALILVVMAKTNSARTFSNRLLRLRDDNRGIGNGKLLFFSGFLFTEENIQGLQLITMKTDISIDDGEFTAIREKRVKNIRDCKELCERACEGSVKGACG